MRLPIFSVTFWPSEALTCGLFNTRVRLSVSRAFSRAPGKVVENWLVESLASWLKGMVLPVVVEVGVVVVVVVVGVVVVGVVVVVVVPLGAKLIGTFNPAVPAEAIVAARSRVCWLLASITRTSTTTSDLGLSR